MKRNAFQILTAVVLVGGLATSCAGTSGTATVDANAVTSSAVTTTSTTAPVVNLVDVPSLIGLSAEEATASLESAGFTVMVNGETNKPEYKVISQIPAPATKAEKGTRVLVSVGESEDQKTARELAESEAAAAASAAAAAEAEAAAAAEAEAAEAAAAEAAAAAAADADLGPYQQVDARGWALVAKDPDSHVGEKYEIYGAVFQFDAATGTKMFLARTGASEEEYSYQYDVNTLVTATDASRVSDIVEGDILRIYVKVTGSYSYDTQIGGSTIATKVAIQSFDLLGHDN